MATGSEPELFKPTVEETVRYESPVGRLPWRMKAATVLGGKEMQGDMPVRV